MQRGDPAAVVVIDDVPESLEHLQSLVLEVPGLTLEGSAGSPADAVELAAARQPDIMILDLFLTGGSGIEVLREIRRRGLDVRVIAVTGNPSDELREACLALGARFFFDKAFEFDQIQAALRTLLAEPAHAG